MTNSLSLESIVSASTNGLWNARFTIGNIVALLASSRDGAIQSHHTTTFPSFGSAHVSLVSHLEIRDERWGMSSSRGRCVLYHGERERGAWLEERK